MSGLNRKVIGLSMPESWSNKNSKQQNTVSAAAPGYVYDPVYLEHNTGASPENARRLEAIISDLDWKGIRQQLTAIPARPATVDEIMAVHDRDYISQVETYCQQGGGWWDQDTAMSPGSYKAALYAAGGTIAAVDSVIKGEVPCAYALVRPPGHHAIKNNAMGFCLFNNVAIAVKYALKTLQLERILIIDFDVHHGNGTQEALAGNTHVLYISTHQQRLFPGTGNLGDTERGNEPGTAINIPLPAGCGDTEYKQVFKEIVVPATRRFKPEIIMVSAGYDAHWADGQADMYMTLDGFYFFARTIQQLAGELCGGKQVFCLEGGYNRQVLMCAINATFGLWLGQSFYDDPFGPPQRESNPPDINDLIKEVKKFHRL
jgi:acetoin utilization deacetylase AcuC-like enzyme